MSAIVAVRNEGRHLEATLRSLLAQERLAQEDLEVLVVDGRSTDDSRAITARLASEDARVRPVDNPGVTAPCAFNRGLEAARGEYVAILGAHARYASDYLATCLAELEARGVAGCSGRVVAEPADAALGSRLAWLVLAHPLGVSGRSFRTQPEGFADSIPYPVYRRAQLLAIGGYDEGLTRNQDNDLNFRLRQVGARLWLTHRTQARYRTRAGFRGLLGYAWTNGSWCGLCARWRPGILGLRHLAPAGFLALATAGVLIATLFPALPLAARATLLAPLPFHLLVGHAAGVREAWRHRAAWPLLLPWALLAFHLGYGAAFLAGLARDPPLRLPTRGPGGLDDPLSAGILKAAGNVTRGDRGTNA